MLTEGIKGCIQETEDLGNPGTQRISSEDPMAGPETNSGNPMGRIPQVPELTHGTIK